MSKRDLEAYSDYSYKSNMDLAKTISDFGELNNTRPDWHEPDEQGVIVRVVGTKLDNAFGNTVQAQAIVNGYQEVVILLRNEDTDEGVDINLASLLATVEMLYRKLENP